MKPVVVLLAFLLSLAGCSVVSPEGPTYVSFDVEVCQDGSKDGIKQPATPCYTLPNVSLPNDADEFAAFAAAMVTFYAGPLVGDIKSCIVTTKVTPGVGSATAVSTAVCRNITQSVSIKLTQKE